MPRPAAKTRVLPGFGLSLGFSLTYLSLIVLLPIAALVLKSVTMGWGEFWQAVGHPRTLAAYRFSLLASLFAAIANVVIGLLIAWVLARYTFFGRRVMDAIIDLPFALPTAVAGVALLTLYSEKGWLGSILNTVHFGFPWPVWRGMGPGNYWPIGYEWFHGVGSTPLGVIIALSFVGLPFVVRTVQPVLEDLGREVEEASTSLGATRFQTFRKVVLPSLYPALLTGFALSFARGLGEYGSVIFIAGRNESTNIAPLEIIAMTQMHEYARATAVAVGLLVISFFILLGVNLVQRLLSLRGGEPA